MEIDFSKSQVEVYRLILVSIQEEMKYNGPFFRLKNQKFIIKKARMDELQFEQRSIDELFLEGNNLRIKCGDNKTLILDKIRKGSTLGYPKEPNGESVIIKKYIFSYLLINQLINA